MTPPEVAALAKRILAEIPERDPLGARRHHYHDRKRIASDLDGLRAHSHEPDGNWLMCGDREFAAWKGCPDYQRYRDGLLRTGRVYGIEP